MGRPRRYLERCEVVAEVARATLRYWAAAKAAAGTREERYDAGTLAEALAAARECHDRQFATVLARSTLLVDGIAVGSRSHEQVILTEGTTIEVLPPFAGG